MDNLLRSISQLGAGFILTCVTFTWIYIALQVYKPLYLRWRHNVRPAANPTVFDIAQMPQRRDWQYTEPFLNKITEFRNDIDR